LFVPPGVAPSPSVVEEGPEADFTVDSLASALDIIEQSAG
jgi:hypothetical protein